MWLVALAVLATDSTLILAIPVAPTESLSVAVRGTGDPIVLIPGLFGSAYAFRHVTPVLADRGMRVITIEPLAIGRSSRPKDADYSLTAQAERVAAVMDTLGIRHALVVAHSVGAAIAFRLAIERPELVAGLVSIEGGPTESATTAGFKRAMKLSWLLKLVGGPDLVRAEAKKNLVASSVDTSWITLEVIDGYTAGAQANFGGTIDAFKTMSKAEEPWLLGPRLAELRCPVRLVLGISRHRSGPPPEEVVFLAATLPDFAVDSVPNVGHFVFEERPEAVVASVDRLRQAKALAAQAGGGR